GGERVARRARTLGFREPHRGRFVVERLERLARARHELRREPLACGARSLVLGGELDQLREMIARARAGRREQSVPGHRGRERGVGFGERIALGCLAGFARRLRGRRASLGTRALALACNLALPLGRDARFLERRELLGKLGGAAVLRKRTENALRRLCGVLDAALLERRRAAPQELRRDLLEAGARGRGVRRIAAREARVQRPGAVLLGLDEHAG